MRTWTARTAAGAAPQAILAALTDPARMSLSAHGPVHMDVDYVVAPAGRGSEVTASVSIRPAAGLLGSLVAGATVGLLEADVLDAAVNRLAREAAGSRKETTHVADTHRSP